MRSKTAATQISVVIFLLAIAHPLASQPQIDKVQIFNSPVDQTTAVRFCDTAEEQYFHYPLIFRAVDPDDPRLNTAPIASREGRTAFITKNELSQLIKALEQSNMPWKLSRKVKSLKWEPPLACFSGMDVLVVCSNGSATSTIKPANICESLKSLDAMLRTPRALWEFQLFRHGYGCEVPGFNFQAYPDHAY